MVATLRALAVAVTLAFVGGTAHAGKIAVANVTAEPDVGDEAGAITLLVRSALAGGDRPVIDAPAGMTVGEALVTLEKANAEHAVLMDLGRDGMKLRLTLVIVPLEADPIVHVVRAGDGDVGMLARGAVDKIASALALTKQPRVPDVSFGRLHPFAAALRLRATDPQKAADALRDGHPSIAIAVPAAATLLAGLPDQAADPGGAARAARALGEVATLDKIGAGTDEIAVMARALAAIARSDLATARQELGTKPPKTNVSILVAAILAEIANDRKKLNELVAQGAAIERSGVAGPRSAAERRGEMIEPARALIAFAASVGSFDNATNAVLVAGAEKIAAIAPGVASQIGLAAAEAGVDVPRALALVSARELDDLELARLEPMVAKGSDATSLRLRAEILLRRGDDRAVVAIGTFASEAPGDPRSARYQGWALASKGKYVEAAAQFAKAGAKRERARALFAAADAKAARAAIEGQPMTAEELTTVGSLAITENKLPEAEQSLRSAERAAPVSPIVQATIAVLAAKQGNQARVRSARLLSGYRGDLPTADPATVIVSGGSAQKPVGTTPERVVIDLKGSDPRILEPMIEALQLAQLAKRKIVLVELGWSPSVLSFRQTHPEIVGDMLAELLAGAPYEIQVVREPTPFHGDTVPLDRLVDVTGELDAALVYRVEPAGSDTRLTLLLYQTGATQATQVSRVVTMPRVVMFNTVKLVVTLAVIVLIALLGILWFTRSMGKVEIQIARAADTDESLCVEVTKRSTRPQLPDMLEFHNACKAAGAKHRRRAATLIASGTMFKIPTGSWYVHLYGTYSHAGKLRFVPDTCTRQIDVKRGATVEVNFDLVARQAEVTLEVITEAKDVTVVVNNETTKHKPENGKLELMLPVGHHTIHVRAGNDELAMPLHVPSAKAIRMGINVARELRLQKDLELGVDTEQAGELELVIAQGPRTPLPFSPTEVTAAKRKGKITKAPIPGSTLLGRYRITAELGRGAMGVVFRAWDEKLERKVAIKVMADELSAIPEAMELFIAEAKALAQLNHTNIVAMYDQVTEDDKVYMIMEFVDGKPLEAIIAERKVLPWMEAAGIIDQVCAGLAYAHARKVIHRDIKPANIFVGVDKAIKLGDFGLARVMREVTIRRTEIRGTPLYMAPEQITGTDVDQRSDLYAIGCTMFELVCGRPPFIDGDILYAQVHHAPPPPSSFNHDLPKPLEALILALLAKDPDDRPGSAAEVRTTLRDLSSV